MNSKKPRRVTTTYLSPLQEEETLKPSSPSSSQESWCAPVIPELNGAPKIASDTDDDDEEILPPTPPPTPEKVIPPDIDKMEDAIDGGLTQMLVHTLKTGLLHLLGLTIRKLRVMDCYGCEVSHPSQKQHACLDHLEEDYYENNFYKVVKTLCTPTFIPAIQRLLHHRRIYIEDARVRAIVETVLFQLREDKNILETIDGAYSDAYWKRYLKPMTEVWEGKI